MPWKLNGHIVPPAKGNVYARNSISITAVTYPLCAHLHDHVFAILIKR